MPQEFIPLADETGLIVPIGRWVIGETCRWLAKWQQHAPNLLMSLNVSARQLVGDGLVSSICDAIAESSIDPACLTLEITESVLMDDVDFSLQTLSALRATGVKISIDDFGTGYSSFSYLNKFPIDVLKIDRSFISGLPEDACEVALVQAILTIGKALRLSVIAEGVESDAQSEMLVQLGCTKAQGYLFHLPLSPQDFEDQLISKPRAPLR